MSLSHFVAVTGIIIKDGKYLILKRSAKEKFWPGKWTVPGGKLDKADYVREKDTGDAWYNILEMALQREIKEETSLQVNNIGYVTSLTVERAYGVLSLIVSLYCTWESGEVILNDEHTEYNWVSSEEAKKYDLIEGILEEIQMVDRKLKGETGHGWSRNGI